MAKSALLLDTNLLLLLVVGLTDKAFIIKHSRLSAFDATDWHLLVDLISVSDGVLLMPQVLAETSNLLPGKLQDPIKSELARRFSQLINDAQERTVPARVAANREEFVRLGFTDAALLACSEGNGIILTADANLHLSALNAGLASINFNHERDRRPDFQLA